MSCQRTHVFFLLAVLTSSGCSLTARELPPNIRVEPAVSPESVEPDPAVEPIFQPYADADTAGRGDFISPQQARESIVLSADCFGKNAEKERCQE